MAALLLEESGFDVTSIDSRKLDIGTIFPLLQEDVPVMECLKTRTGVLFGEKVQPHQVST
ncbi:MAG: hypothetical protein P8172_17285 [Gammaproteobacteria bacterium]